MESNVKNILSFALKAMIDLAEASGAEVRMTFQSVAMVVKPGRSAAELMEEFERNEKLVKLADELSTLLMSLFDLGEFRIFCSQLRNGGRAIVDEIPNTGSPRSQIMEGALLLCGRGFVLQDSFWESLVLKRPSRAEPTEEYPLGIGPLRRLVVERLAGTDGTTQP